MGLFPVKFQGMKPKGKISGAFRKSLESSYSPPDLGRGSAASSVTEEHSDLYKTSPESRKL